MLNLTGMDMDHLAWPFFAHNHRKFARDFHHWVRTELTEFEQDEGGDGRAARHIFELLAAAGWLHRTLPAGTSKPEAKLDLREQCLMREICAFSSAIADVALSEPWLAILPIALHGSRELKEELLPGYLSGQLLPAFALSEPDAGSDAAAIATTARSE